MLQRISINPYVRNEIITSHLGLQRLELNDADIITRAIN